MNIHSRLELIKMIPYDQQIEIIENEFRKDWTESEKSQIQKILKIQLNKEKTSGKRTDLEQTQTSVNDLTQVKKLNSKRIDAEVGKVFGESHETVRKRTKVFENIDEVTKKALDSGKTSLNSAYKKKIITENNAKPIPPLPKGKFNHIVEDPAWPYDNNMGGSGESGAKLQYKTEPVNKIARMGIPDLAADDAVLYMYTTNWYLVTGSMLLSEYLEIMDVNKLDKIVMKYSDKPEKITQLRKEMKQRNEERIKLLGNEKVTSDALAVMNCHGFTPKYIITWEKQEKKGWGGYSFNNVTEHLLIGIRGEVTPFGLSDKTIVKTKWDKKHSKKPEAMWELIEKCVAATRWNHRKIEINCRTPRNGWYPHGNEITAKDIEKWQKQ